MGSNAPRTEIISSEDNYFIGKIITGCAIALILYHLYACFMGTITVMKLRSYHLGLITVMALLMQIRGKTVWNIKNAIFIVLAIASTVSSVYIYLVDQDLVFHLGAPDNLEIILGILIIISIIISTGKKVSWALAIIASISIPYAYFGEYAPWIIANRGYDLSRLISHLYLSNEGIYGTPIGVSASVVVQFVIFGSFMTASGTGNVFIQLAFSLFGRFRGGPAKVSVFSSALFGTISGSAVANVYVDGVFTIPLMKKNGFSSEMAGGIEAVTSTGGQIMPPVMGAAAFVMAEVLGIPYSKIILYAIIPAFLYYLSLYLMIDFYAVNNKLVGLPSRELPHPVELLKKDWHLLAPLVVLVILLLGFNYSPIKSAFGGTVACFLASWVKKESRMGIKKVLSALEDAGKSIIEIALACGAAGIVIGVLSLTGLGMKISGILVILSGGKVFVLAVFIAISGIILGMGLPTVGVYIVLAVVMAPALIQLGIQPIVAHFFAFHYGVLAAITPPVALAVYAGAAIAHGDFWKTGIAAIKIGIVTFIIPFMYLYGPEILGIGLWYEVLQAVVSSSIAIFGIASAVQGYPIKNVPVRILIAFFALNLFVVGLITDIIGFIGLCLVFSIWFIHRRRSSLTSK